MFGIIKKMFFVWLSSLVIASNHTKCVLLSIQKCETQPTLINLHPNEYSQEFHFYLFLVKLDRCSGSCYTLNELSNKICIPSKTEDLNLSVFNMITGINESKTLAKDIPCECKFDKCRCESKKIHVCEKDYVWNPTKCTCEKVKHLSSIKDDSVIISDEVIVLYDEEIKNIPTNFNENKVTRKMLLLTC